MAVYNQNTSLTTTWTINDSDSTWTLGENAEITVGDMVGQNYGVHDDSSRSGNVINIRGDINANVPFASTAISLLGDDSRVHIFASSEIKATTYGILSTSENGRYVNDGSITANQFGIFASNGKSIVNNGEINAATGLASGTADVRMENSGSIASFFSGIKADMGGAKIVNHQGGEIDSKIDGVYLGGTDASSLVNRGIITGDTHSIMDGDGDLTVRNFGTLNGDVMLGAGTDSFDTRGGTLVGKVYGGDGDDSYFVSSTSIVLVEQSDEGNDRVLAGVDYQLGANIESLTLLGKDDAKGTGNMLGNELIGNKGDNRLFGLGGSDALGGSSGDDQLTGGNNNDVFIFNSGDDHDVIHDFKDGADLLFMSFVDSAGDFADLKLHHVKQDGDDLVITYGNDQLIIEDMKKSHLSFADFID